MSPSQGLKHKSVASTLVLCHHTAKQIKAYLGRTDVTRPTHTHHHCTQAFHRQRKPAPLFFARARLDGECGSGLLPKTHQFHLLHQVASFVWRQMAWNCSHRGLCHVVIQIIRQFELNPHPHLISHGGAMHRATLSAARTHTRV